MQKKLYLLYRYLFTIGDKEGLPHPLNLYSDKDFATKLKVRFIYYLCLSCIAVIIPILVYTYYIQTMDKNFNTIFYPILFAEAFIIILFIVCLVFLIKGHVNFAAHLLLSSALACVWFIIWIDRGDPLMKYDSIVFILTILSMLPLFMSKNKFTIPFYIGVNLIVLFLFAKNAINQNHLPYATAVDFFSDSAISIIFIGILSYNIFRISKMSLDKASDDLNKRISAEEALAKSEKRYREMADLLPQTIFEYDLAGKLTYVNKNGLELFGYTQEDFDGGINLISTLAPEDREKGLNNVKRILQGESILGNEYTAIKKDGTKFPIAIYSARIIENDKTVGLRGILIDLTEAKNNAESIRQNEEKFRSIIQGLSDIIFIIDRDGKISYQSPSVFKSFGYTEEDTFGRTPFEFIHPDDIAISAEQLKKVYESSNEGTPTFARIIHKNGSTIYLEAIGMNMLENKYVNGVVIFGRNITERVLAEHELKESEERYRTLMESMNEVVMMVDNDDTVLYVNKRFYEVLGYSKEDIIGKTGYKVLLEEKDHGIIIEKSKIRQNKVAGQYEIQFRTKDNLWKDFLIGAAPILNSADEVIGSIGVMTDITERKKIEKELDKHRKSLELLVQERTTELASTIEELGFANEELLRQREELQIANRELDSFSYSVSHDLRSPLRALNGFAQIVIEDYSKILPADAVKYLNKIQSGANHMGVLINEILRFSRISRQPALMDNINLDSLLQEIWVTLENERTNRDIELIANPLPECLGDRPLLKQVLFNILNNALKYSRNNTKTIIEIGAVDDHKEHHHMNVYFIKDNGVGFDMKYYNKLFGVFQRLHTDKEFEGIGVGLAIVQRIVERHGGRVWAQSVKGKGTTFFFSLKKISKQQLLPN